MSRSILLDPTDRTRPAESKIKPGDIVAVLRLDHELEERDHVIVSYSAEMKPVPREFVGKLKGEVYLRETVLRPLTEDEMVSVGVAIAREIKGKK